jgi:Ni,Fe-hydrogenase maturation factor
MRLGTQPGATVHEGGAGTLLATSALLGDLPAEVFVVGVEPELVETGIGLPATVAAAVPEAVETTRRAVEKLINEIDRSQSSPLNAGSPEAGTPTG